MTFIVEPRLIAIATIFSSLFTLTEVMAKDIDPYLRPASVPAPENNTSTPARIDLGKKLFFDPRLSGSNWISCATCHNPALGWSDGRPTAMGDGMKVLNRATPTILNTAYNPLQMWDGRAPSLEDQAIGPIAAAGEMNQDMELLLTELSAIPGYRKLFDEAYPGEGITRTTIGKAIANFERTVVSAESSFDAWRRGDSSAISDQAKRGFALFDGKAKCSACHQGFNFVDDGFHNIGLKSTGTAVDEGRFAQKKVKSMKGAFKTPTLRDIALTAPYMHNGIYKTLEEVVDHYSRGGDTTENLDPNIKALNLTAQERADLVAFLRTLTGPQVLVTIPQLPY